MGLKLDICIAFVFIVMLFLIWANIKVIAGGYVIGDFKNEINKESVSVKEVAQIIKNECSNTTQQNCLLVQSSNWVKNNIKYRDLDFFESHFNWNIDTENIYKKGGNCRQIAIFTASLWRELGFKDIYLITQENDSMSHIFTGITQEQSIMYSNYIENLTIYQIVKVV